MPYADLNDDLSDLLEPGFVPRVLPSDEASVRMRKVVEEFKDECPKCRGTGRFTSYTGRQVGQCFACKGKGHKVYKTSAEDRAAARDRVASKKAAAMTDFVENNREMVNYLTARAERWQFAGDMIANIAKYGSLTDNQIAAVKRAMDRDAARDEQRQIERAERIATAPMVDISKVKVSLDRALASGLKAPKLYLSGFTFTLAKATSANAGAVYVKAGETYLGKIVDGKLMRSHECTPAQADEIVRVSADPAKAAVEFGKLTGRCACCYRTLTDPMSVARSIGPICAEKYGF